MPFRIARELQSVGSMKSSKRVHLIANSKSGKGKGAELVEKAGEVCQELGYELVTYDTSSPRDFDKRSEEAVAAAEKDGGILVAAGGDGTIRGVAQAAHGKPVRFAAVPCGTFNYFARTHNIPEEPIEAFRLALTGEVRPVRLGVLNGHVFLINASLGLYAKAIREREQATSRFGRSRLVAILSSIVSLFSRHFLLKVDLVSDQKNQTVYTPMIFLGNNALQLRNLDMDVAQCMKQDRLAAVLMKPVTKLETLRIMFRGIFKTLEKDERLDTFCVEELTIHMRRGFHTVALDGELFQMRAPLRVQAVPEVLNLVLPPRGTPA